MDQKSTKHKKKGENKKNVKNQNQDDETDSKIEECEKDVNISIEQNLEGFASNKVNQSQQIEIRVEESIRNFSKFVDKPDCDDSPMNTKSFFFSLKDKQKGVKENQRLLSNYRLKKIKRLHEPIDYDVLKQREVAYLSTMMLKKEANKDVLKNKIKDRENAFKVSYKSKTHNKIDEQYK